VQTFATKVPDRFPPGWAWRTVCDRLAGARRCLAYVCCHPRRPEHETGRHHFVSWAGSEELALLRARAEPLLILRGALINNPTRRPWMNRNDGCIAWWQTVSRARFISHRIARMASP